MNLQGLDISIETDKGDVRNWYDPHNNTSGSTTLQYPYGYVRRTTGDDDEHIDIYVGPNEDEKTLYIVNQLKAPEFKEHDEQKVMAGFSSAKEAKQAYLAHYDNPKFFGSMDEMTVDDFKSEFVKKALPGMEDVPQFSYDVDDLRNVEHWLGSIDGLKDNDLIALSTEIWGAGYKYQQVHPEYIRSEIRGFLKDQSELLQQVPPVPQGQEGELPPADQMPHAQ